MINTERFLDINNKIIFQPIASNLLSNDSQMRCNVVDLYFALYGSKRPQCLPTAELSAMLNLPKIPKISGEVKYRPSSPIQANDESDRIPYENNIIETKQEPELLIVDEAGDEHITIKAETFEMARVKNTILSAFKYYPTILIFVNNRKIYRCQWIPKWHLNSLKQRKLKPNFVQTILYRYQVSFQVHINIRGVQSTGVLYSHLKITKARCTSCQRHLLDKTSKFS